MAYSVAVAWKPRTGWQLKGFSSTGFLPMEVNWTIVRILIIASILLWIGGRFVDDYTGKNELECWISDRMLQCARASFYGAMVIAVLLIIYALL